MSLVKFLALPVFIYCVCDLGLSFYAFGLGAPEMNPIMKAALSSDIGFILAKMTMVPVLITVYFINDTDANKMMYRRVVILAGSLICVLNTFAICEWSGYI